MVLNNSYPLNRTEWEKAGYELPRFNRDKVTENTIKNPVWLHFGRVIFLGFPAVLQQRLIDEEKSDRGIIVCEGYDYEIIDRIYKPYDNLSVLIVLKPDGNMRKKLVVSVVKALTADTNRPEDWQDLKEIFKKPSLQMASFTITEKGYGLTNAKGEFYDDISFDLQNGPENPKSFIGKLAALCYERYKSGKYPIALVSMDNCSHNGTKLFQAVDTFAREWVEHGIVDKGFGSILKILKLYHSPGA